MVTSRPLSGTRSVQIGLQSPDRDLKASAANASLQKPSDTRTAEDPDHVTGEPVALVSSLSRSPSGTRVDDCSQSPDSFARPCKQAQSQAQSARSLTTL